MIFLIGRMKISFLKCCLLCLISNWVLVVYADNTLKDLTDSLDFVLSHKQEYVVEKEKRIEQIKKMLDEHDISSVRKYEIHSALYSEYKKFNIDSALYYVNRNLQIALSRNVSYWEYESELRLTLLYSMCGMYREAENILKEINSQALPKRLLPEYYNAYCRFFEYYAASVSRDQYTTQYRLYEDSLLSVLDTASFDYKSRMASRYFGVDNSKTEKILGDLLMTTNLGSPDYAIVTHALASLNQARGNAMEEKKYFILSAISDLQNATRENASMQNLAEIAYKENDLGNAFKFTQSAIDDAIASGISFRVARMYKFYSIISANYQAKEAKVKSDLMNYFIMICVFSGFLVLLVIYIYLQWKKISRIKEELSDSNVKFQKLNETLHNVNELLNEKNTQLVEVNHIKEQYIAQFFNMCSDYIGKMENYQRTLYKLAINKHYEELIKSLKSTATVDSELNVLYGHFDSIFLSLYPTFVPDFNALLMDGEKVTLRQGNLFNTELRIYALLRLGITDTGKIASFLRCSMSTIYNYRTKMRNKAIVDKESFEQRVMHIGEVHQLSERD